jgi:ribosomal protein S18 acetylase RimI-like enzyme
METRQTPTITGIEIRPLREDELDAFIQQMPYGRPPEVHRERLLMQQLGEGLYLAAWRGDEPVGHIILRWEGTLREPMASRLADCSHIGDFFVVPHYRSVGIGNLMMDRCETLARERGYTSIGLSVATTNTRARALYERRGYRDTGFGTFPARWTNFFSDGRTEEHEEELIYMVKSLDPFAAPPDLG